MNTRNNLAIALSLAIVCAGCSREGAEEAPAVAEQTPPPSAEAPAARQNSAPETTTSSELAGTKWRLVEIASMDDTTLTPDDRDLYTLEFSADGTARLRADCNRANGSWSSESGSQLRFGPLAGTRAMCPPGSLHDDYLQQFEWVRSYVLKDGHLFLATMADGSIIEFEPFDDVPVAATVLGEEIRTEDADEMQSAVLGALFEQYRTENGIEATPAEIDAFLAYMERTKENDIAERKARLTGIDERLATGDLAGEERQTLQRERDMLAELVADLGTPEELSAEEQGQVDEMRRGFAEAMIERWKLNRALYQQYGGRIIFQQAGPEPLDAYRQFLEERRDAGAFTIRREEFEDDFWRYFTDDSMHSFLEPDSAEEAEVFSAPPWNE